MGAITKPYTFVTGATPTATNWNANPDTIIAEINGQLDAANVDTTSADGIVTMNTASQNITGLKIFSGGIDLSGAKIDLDTDNDTSLSAPTDDQIDIEIGTSVYELRRWPAGVTAGLAFANATAGAGMTMSLHTEDGDGSDSIWYRVYGVGDSAENTNYEYVEFGYSGSDAGAQIGRLISNAAGTGTVRPLRLETGSNAQQLELNIDGSILVGAGLLDLNANKLVLDADADTSITADTDDQIDFEVAGADMVRLASGSLAVLADDYAAGAGPSVAVQHNNNGSTPAAGTLRLNDLNGTQYILWVDGTGDLRINATTAPTNATDVSIGTVVGTQT